MPTGWLLRFSLCTLQVVASFLGGFVPCCLSVPPFRFAPELKEDSSEMICVIYNNAKKLFRV